MLCKKCGKESFDGCYCPFCGEKNISMSPHNATMILVFGIIGVVFCQIFGIIAWVMGYNDMKKIKAGQMDPEGKGMTQAGMILGIIGTAFLVISIFFIIIMLVFYAFIFIEYFDKLKQ